MPTPPIGGGPPEFDVPGNSANYGGPSNFSGMQDALNAMASSNLELNKSMAQLVESLSDAYEQAAKLRKETDNMGDDIKDTVNTQERMVAMFKQAVSLQRDLNTKIASQKSTYKDVQEQVKKLLDYNNKLLASGKMSSTQVRALQSNVKALSAVYDDASKKAKQYGSNVKVVEDAMKSYGVTLNAVTRHMGSLAAAQGKLEQSRLERHVVQLNKSYRDAGQSIKIFNSLEEMFARRRAARELQDARKEHRNQSQASHKAKMEAAAGPAAGLLGLELPRTRSGSIDWQALKNRPKDAAAAKAARGLDYNEMAKNVAFRGGEGMLGRADKFLSARAMRTRALAAAGENPGLMGRAGMAAADAGEGSVGAGMAEGAMGALPAVAIGAAIFKVIEGFIDKQAITNQGIEKGLGGALFTPGKSGGEALNTVRQNLSANLFNAYGQNLDKNLAIAGAMQEQGLDISELSSGSIRGKRLAGGGAPDTGAGFLGGTFGEFQRNAMTAGRGIGLTDSQTVVRMTKMLQEMRQTFEATHDFLESVNVQARAAGISTTKYLSIIDDLTAQFDKMNKSFNETVSIVQSLGASGTDTADKIKDMANALTGANENKTLEQKAFAFTQMTPQMRAALVSTQNDIIQSSVDKLKSAATGAGVNTSGVDLNTPHGLLMFQNTIRKLPNSVQKQQLQSAADDARYQMEQMQSVIKPGTSGTGAGAVQAGYGIEAYGQGAAVQTGIQMTNLMKGLQMSNQTFSDLLKHPENVGMVASAAGPTLGVKATDYQSVLDNIVAQGAGAPNRVLGMSPGANRDKELRHFFDLGKRSGVFSKGTMYDEKAVVNALNDSDMSKQLSEAYENEIASSPELLLKTLTQAVTKGNETAQDAQTKDVALETRTTADIYANAFEKFFSMLVDAIMDIKHILDGWSMKQFGQLFSGAGVSKDTGQMMDHMQALGMFNKVTDKLRDASASGNQGATDQLAALQAYQMAKPEDRTEEQAQKVASILRTNTIAGFDPANTDWKSLMSQPDISKQALDEQFIRSQSDAMGGGQFGAADAQGNSSQFWLGKTLSGAQLDALDKLAKAVLGSGVQNYTDAAGNSHQYININMNSTDIAAFQNRFPDLTNLKSSETTTGVQQAGVTAKSGTGVTTRH